MAKTDPRMFWVGVVAGFAVMFIINSIVATVTSTIISLFSTIIGGFVAGWIAGGGASNGGKAGLLAGVVNAVVVAILIAGFGLVPSPEDLSFLAVLGSTLLVIIALFPLWGLLGYFGGAIAGKVKTL